MVSSGIRLNYWSLVESDGIVESWAESCVHSSGIVVTRNHGIVGGIGWGLVESGGIIGF